METVIGIVTMENVLEQIVGPVEDEFDLETPDIVPDGPGCFIIQGGTPVNVVRQRLLLDLDDADVDTFSGLLMQVSGELPEAGQTVDLGGATAEILDVKQSRAQRIRVTMQDD